MVNITADSFTFGGVDMFEQYGIMMLHYDVLLPKLRERKVTIPMRSGAYDYGAKFYDERTIKVECDTRRSLSKDEVREMAYLLSKKNQLRFWNEPDRYYIGRVYDTAELNYIGSIGYEFSLSFVCEPFAYGETVQAEVPRKFIVDYKGTAPTPTRLTIKNVGTKNVTGIQVRIRERKDVY